VSVDISATKQRHSRCHGAAVGSRTGARRAGCAPAVPTLARTHASWTWSAAATPACRFAWSATWPARRARP